MNQKVAHILEQAKNLNADEREALIDALLDDEDSDHGGFATTEVAKAWEEEIERRIAAYDRGELETIDISEVTLESLRRWRLSCFCKLVSIFEGRCVFTIKKVTI